MNIKALLIVLTTVALFAGSLYFVTHFKSSDAPHSDSLQEKWQSFKSAYGKKYADPDYEMYRIGVFSENLKFVEGQETMGVTQFMDLTNQEFKETYLTLQVESPENVETINDEDASHVDWQKSGKVSRVKDQGQCGSCWAFSTTGSVESALILANKEKKTVDLSEQELVDCSRSYGNNGCSGGLMDAGFKYIIEKGVTYEKSYSYTATDGQCKDTSSMKKAHISKSADVSQGNCSQLKTALKQQPISIAVDANNWQFYTKGVFSNCGQSLDHGVLLVGFVSKEGKDAYKVKNSWNTTWGEAGFIYLADGNTCGLCNMASYPTV